MSLFFEETVVMLEFITNVEKRVVGCPNPKCASHEDPAVLRGHEMFQQGQILEIFIQDGMETIGAFVLGCHDSVRCDI